jgi:hypothetical protein
MSYGKTTLTLRDEDGYNRALGDAGLAPDWVVLGDHKVDKDFAAPGASRKFEYKFSGYPIENPDMFVPNPKDLVTKGLGSIPELRLSMQATYLEIVLGLYTGGSTMDAAEAYSTPVFMLMQAVDSMAQAKVLAAKEEKIEEKEAERKKNFIILIISVVLLVSETQGEIISSSFATLTDSSSSSFPSWVRKLHWQPDSLFLHARLLLLASLVILHLLSTILCKTQNPLLSISWACCLVLGRLPKLNAMDKALAMSLGSNVE